MSHLFEICSGIGQCMLFASLSGQLIGKKEKFMLFVVCCMSFATPEKFRNINSIILCIAFPLLLAYMYYIRKFIKV